MPESSEVAIDTIDTTVPVDPSLGPNVEAMQRLIEMTASLEPLKTRPDILLQRASEIAPPATPVDTGFMGETTVRQALKNVGLSLDGATEVPLTELLKLRPDLAAYMKILMRKLAEPAPTHGSAVTSPLPRPDYNDTDLTVRVSSPQGFGAKKRHVVQAVELSSTKPGDHARLIALMPAAPPPPRATPLRGPLPSLPVR